MHAYEVRLGNSRQETAVLGQGLFSGIVVSGGHWTTLTCPKRLHKLAQFVKCNTMSGREMVKYTTLTISRLYREGSEMRSVSLLLIFRLGFMDNDAGLESKNLVSSSSVKVYFL